MPTLILSGSNVRDLLDMKNAIDAVEQAFRQLAHGAAQMPAKSYLVLEKGDFRAMPAAIAGAVGIKWVNVHPQNPARGLPTVMGSLIYNDPDTGYPLAIMDATGITAYRTGATAAIASKYLARKDARTLGIVGAGRQAYTQLLAHAELFDLEQVLVYDLSTAAIDRFIADFPQFPVKASRLGEVAAADIVCTVTPARQPVLRKEWVRPGTHINAIGADAKGKEELEPAILKSAVVVVDDIEQATGGGEINVPISRGLFTESDIYATLADIVSGKKPGRRSNDEITIFDSTGIAIEDIACARIIYEKAKQSGKYLSIDFIEG
ncbi:MAG: ornithine cyclodeaminase family protein [Dehalococcoidales bacterium]|nr:ornithine cyclodeaminase family protein [Dehalococcoidales bacterium]